MIYVCINCGRCRCPKFLTLVIYKKKAKTNSTDPGQTASEDCSSLKYFVNDSLDNPHFI